MKIPRRLHFILATLLTVGILALIGVIIVWYARTRLTETLIKRYTQQETIVALQIAETAKDDIETSHSFLGAISEMPEVASGDSKSCSAKLKSLRVIFPKHIDRITRLDSHGIITCSTEERLIGLNATIFDDTIEELINDPDHNPLVGDLSIPPGGDEYTIGYYYPLRNAKREFIGALKAITNISTIRLQYEQNPAFKYTGEPILIDHTGDILYAADSSLLNQNIKSGTIESKAIQQNTLQYLLRLSEQRPAGDISYIMSSRDHYATYRKIDIVPGHWWLLVLATDSDNIEQTFLAELYRLLRALALANLFAVLIILSVYICYTTRHLIRPEAIISSKHEEHMKKNLGEINRAFGVVSKKLGKFEQHLEHDINALHNEADKKRAVKYGK